MPIYLGMWGVCPSVMAGNVDAVPNIYVLRIEGESPDRKDGPKERPLRIHVTTCPRYYCTMCMCSEFTGPSEGLGLCSQRFQVFLTFFVGIS